MQRVEVIGTTPLPGLGTPLEGRPANVQIYGSKELGKQRPGSLAEFLEQEPDQRHRQRRAGKPLPARHQFPRLHGVAAARHAARAVGVPGRRAHQRALRRRRQLGLVAAVGDRRHPAHPRLESGVRPQHAGRRARDLHEERRASIRARVPRSRAARSGAVDAAGRAGRRARPLRLVRHRQRLEGQRLGRAQPEPDRAVLRQGRLPGPSATTSTSASRPPTTARRHADVAAVVPGRPPQAYTFPDINKNQLVILAVKGSHFLDRNAADRRQRLLCAATATTTSQQRQRRLRRVDPTPGPPTTCRP